MRALSSRVWLQHAFAGVSLVVFTATSTIYTHESRESANLTTRPHGDISQNDLRELIDRIAARHGLDCSTCGSLIEGRQYDTRESGALSLVARLEPDSGHLFYEIASSAGKPDEVRRKEVDSLRNELVSELRARYPSLTIDKLGKLRPDTAQLLVYHTRKGSYRNPENVRDFEIARELVRASLLSYGIAPHGSSEVTEHYRFGGLVGRNARELTVYLWLGDSALGINVTRQTDRVREMQERVVNDLQGRLEREFGTKRIATDRF